MTEYVTKVALEQIFKRVSHDNPEKVTEAKHRSRKVSTSRQEADNESTKLTSNVTLSQPQPKVNKDTCQEKHGDTFLYLQASQKGTAPEKPDRTDYNYIYKSIWQQEAYAATLQGYLAPRRLRSATQFP